MLTPGDDLDLLLSLQDDRVPETPPASPISHRYHPPGIPKNHQMGRLHTRIPSSSTTGYDSDGGSPKWSRSADMSVFRDAVKDYLDSEPSTAKPVPPKSNKRRKSGEVVVEKFSGLRIRNQLVSSLELTNRFSDIRFVRMPAIKNLILGDTLSGSWATVGVLSEKGATRLSSAGKSYCIWKMGGLDAPNVSVFLFGDAYTRNCEEPVGAVFTLFNSGVRQDAGGKGFSGFSLSVYSAGQVLKIGISTDYGICKGKRKDGMSCPMVINKRRGIYCEYHKSNTAHKYSTMRAELKGGNLWMTPKPKLQSEGIYMVDPLADRTNSRKRVKVLSVDGLKKALSNADKVTTNGHSQGIRFLTQVTASKEPKVQNKGPAKPDQIKVNSKKRPSLAMKMTSKTVTQSEQPDSKRKTTHSSLENMIELEIGSSDEKAYRQSLLIVVSSYAQVQQICIQYSEAKILHFKREGHKL